MQERRIGIVATSAQYVYSLFGSDYSSGYGQAGDRIHHLAVAGIRLVVGELRKDVTKTKKDGTRGRLRIDYGDQREPDAALRWLWRYVDGAKTAGELFGRGLVVAAAEQYAAHLVLPASQRTYRMSWGSHKDIAAKALAKLTAPHLPASLKALERAVERAHAEHRSVIEDSADGSHAPTAEDDAATEGEPTEEIEAEPDDEAKERAVCAPGEH